MAHSLDYSFRDIKSETISLLKMFGKILRTMLKYQKSWNLGKEGRLGDQLGEGCCTKAQRGDPVMVAGGQPQSAARNRQDVVSRQLRGEKCRRRVKGPRNQRDEAVKRGLGEEG